MITSLIFIAWYGKVKYTWSKKHQKETRNQTLQCRFPFLKRASSSSLIWRRPSLPCLWQAVEGASSSPGAPGAHFPRWSRGSAAWPSARGEGRLSAWHSDKVDTLSVWQRVRNRQLSKQANYKTCLQCAVRVIWFWVTKTFFFFSFKFVKTLFFLLYRTTIPSGQNLFLLNSETIILIRQIGMKSIPYVGMEDSANNKLNWPFIA